LAFQSIATISVVVVTVTLHDRAPDGIKDERADIRLTIEIKHASD
jgi:hypothetical protein